jgi:hypothetical protein
MWGSMSSLSGSYQGTQLQSRVRTEVVLWVNISEVKQQVWGCKGIGLWWGSVDILQNYVRQLQCLRCQSHKLGRRISYNIDVSCLVFTYVVCPIIFGSLISTVPNALSTINL